MPSNKETLFQEHICSYLRDNHDFISLSNDELNGIENLRDFHIIEKHLLQFIQKTQEEKYSQLKEQFSTDADIEIIKALKEELTRKELWLIIRNGLNVRGTEIELYKPVPRSNTSDIQKENYLQNIFSFKKEYYYNNLTKERLDIVIFLNGLPIIVVELKHEDEGQTCDDAIYDSFLNRHLENNIYKFPFLFIASSDTEVKVATDPTSENNFRWFNANLINKAEEKDSGEYPVEHLYKHALSKDMILNYLEYFLVFVSAKQKITENNEVVTTPSFTIFPRYHQLRASKNLADDILNIKTETNELGIKYLINHSAGSGKTLTIAWMSDLLDSLYTETNEKIFDNIIILTDRKSLDKNIKDDLQNFTHLTNKIYYAKKSKQLADYLIRDRDIIVTTIHKFSYIQETIAEHPELKNRKIAFLIDEAHRSQDGKMALTMRSSFTNENEEVEIEEELPTIEDEIINEIQNLDISNQVFVAFTATTTPKTVSYFGEPFDSYTEEEAIREGYIFNVAHNILSYTTLYNLQITGIIPGAEDYPVGLVKMALRNLAFNDDSLIQYKSNVIINLFNQNVLNTCNCKGKAMVVASSRPAGLKYFNYIKAIIEAKKLPFKVLFAFSDYNDPITKEPVEEVKLNQLDTLHPNKEIEDVFDLDEYRILVVANKFQTGFDQPLLTSMFLDKYVKGVNAIQTVSRLNRTHPNKKQEEILVVDFTNNSQSIFDAFNRHRTGSPHIHREPDPNILTELYNDINNYNVYTAEEIQEYTELYLQAEKDARDRNSTADAILSNKTQGYRAIFETKIQSPIIRKEYTALLRRFVNQYYFIAQFFEIATNIKDIFVFAEVMGNKLIRKGNTSNFRRAINQVDTSRIGIHYNGVDTNIRTVQTPRRTGLTVRAGNEPPRTTIQAAIEQIEMEFDISSDDILVIKEICEEVSNEGEVKSTVLAYKNENTFLELYESDVKTFVSECYINRDMWDKLEDPLYIDDGGIIPIMSKTIIKEIINIQVA